MNEQEFKDEILLILKQPATFYVKGKIMTNETVREEFEKNTRLGYRLVLSLLNHGCIKGNIGKKTDPESESLVAAKKLYQELPSDEVDFDNVANFFWNSGKKWALRHTESEFQGQREAAKEQFDKLPYPDKETNGMYWHLAKMFWDKGINWFKNRPQE